MTPKGQVSPDIESKSAVPASTGFCTTRLVWISVIALIAVVCVATAIVVPLCLTKGCAAAAAAPHPGTASSAATTTSSALGPTSSGGASLSSPTPSSTTTSLSCTAAFSTGTCVGYSSNYINRTGLSYNSATGIFTGSMTTNQCPYNSAGTYVKVAGSCTSITFPASVYSTVQSGTTKAASLRGPVAYSLRGVNIYGPMDAGFNPGTICTASTGCLAGTDVAMCFEGMQYQCGSAAQSSLGLDACGGHASPYHFHTDLLCDYTLTAPGHSVLIGISLDGRGLYGQYESTGTAPTNLDACNGHSGIVPTTTTSADSTGAIQTFAASTSTSVYHYHTTGSKAPFTIGCYGPVSSLAACKALYPKDCGSGFVNVTTSVANGARYTGTFINYDTDCPCYQDQYGSVYNAITLSNGASQGTG